MATPPQQAGVEAASHGDLPRALAAWARGDQVGATICA
jgi:hypothetical protein